MIRRARIEGVSRLAVMAGAIALSAVGPIATTAQESQKQAAFVTNMPSSAPVNDISISAIFANRWGKASGEFVLGSDGVLAPDTASPSGTDQDNPIGKVAIGFASNKIANNVTDMGKMANGEITHNGVAAPTATSTANVQNCGPSPLSPAEIKSLVVETARRHKVDEVFATAIAWAESGFDQTRNSAKGARGPMQLMPGTATRFGVEDVCDPAQNIEGGMKYLRVLLDEFQNPLLVAAAYNSGEHRIYEHGGIPPFKETVGYVAKVVNYQLGLAMPSARTMTRAAAPAAIADAGDDGNAGVIAVKKTGKFVGGVMHF
ncbi:lytic transglycosylase domain-containing protein [Mesorhizobium sp.]|uniref:lytic transglycosylase domain-containing protein n=1 Tax=Mesorhizobium sp. TaxID=1871066 RepID=UPI000FE5CDA8|nr:lytic transglycosylase domain-containing protein [Mesorhizobium sp.]RWD28677.1 MAG: lytic transglycosylase domain-containing protein [Mesorhizobium sp.]RWE98594.1 MAG: lytic transglycosylase domain-containing protein [Mesorhizobium sp.]